MTRTAIYPGSFDPLTKGHEDLIRRSLSLADRVRAETDPADLAAMVVDQIDAALHPEMVAILVSGPEAGLLVPVIVLHGSADSLPLDGGLAGPVALVFSALELLAILAAVALAARGPRGDTRRLVLASLAALLAFVALGKVLSPQFMLRLAPLAAVAFVLGVVPLVLATGAGAEMRRALGTAVFAGMLGVTAFGIVASWVDRKPARALRPW